MLLMSTAFDTSAGWLHQAHSSHANKSTWQPWQYNATIGNNQKQQLLSLQQSQPNQVSAESTADSNVHLQEQPALSTAGCLPGTTPYNHSPCKPLNSSFFGHKGVEPSLADHTHSHTQL
jgi:hypothetical protein